MADKSCTGQFFLPYPQTKYAQLCRMPDDVKAAIKDAPLNCYFGQTLVSFAACNGHFDCVDAILAQELGLDELEVLADYEGRDRLASMVDSTLRDLRVAQRSRINKMTYWEAVRAVEEQLRGTMLPETERRQAAIHIATKVDRSSILAESLADPSILNGEYANTWLSGPSTSQLGAAIQEWCMLRITTDADQIEAAMESAHLLDVEAGFVVLADTGCPA